MLVTVTSSTSGEIIMFAETARYLFEIAGKECVARGVFTREQLPDAIAKLQRAVANTRDELVESPYVEQGDDERDAQTAPRIGLAQRAHPLIELMERTRDNDGFVMWQAAKDF
jgi:Domain of unknown function (DUF1840)